MNLAAASQQKRMLPMGGKFPIPTADGENKGWKTGKESLRGATCNTKLCAQRFKKGEEVEDGKMPVLCLLRCWQKSDLEH